MKKNKFSKKVVITGSQGCIGTILKDGLSDIFNLYLIDIKERDSANTFNVDISCEYDKLVNIFKNKDIILHLAWNFFEDFPKETIDYKNKVMAENIYKAAIEAGVKRVIMASSVHANDYSFVNKNNKVSPEDNPWPDSPYGASKVYMESLGKYFARYHKLEVICIRFGGVNSKNAVIYEEDPDYDKVLLYKEDCVSVINNCIMAKKVKNFFSVFYAISNNKKSVHDISNSFNWLPKYPLDN
ncbi:MAG: NAD-dependent epimerase/dehydratase family protein [Patescibacteria group bacterium]